MFNAIVGSPWAGWRARFGGAAPLARAAALVACLALIAFAFGPASARADEPLRGQWHLDDFCDGGFPCTEPDSSGNGLDADWVGSPNGLGGRFGGAYSFPDETKYLNAGNHSLLQPANVSLFAWVKAASAPGLIKAVASQGATGSCSHASYALYTGFSPGEGLRFYIDNGSQAVASPAATDAIWDDQWHMVAGTYDGSAVRLYLDGQQVGSGTASAGDIAYGYSGPGDSNDFIIGGYKDPDCIEDTSFTGGVDETRVYSRALSGSEILRLADPSATTPPELIEDPPPPPPPPPRDKPTAKFTRLTEVPRPFAPVTFDASDSIPADDYAIARYDWDLTGDRKADVSCSAANPVFTTNTLSPSVKAISLDVIDITGARDNFVSSINIPALSYSNRTTAAIHATDVAPKLTGSPYVGGLCSSSGGVPFDSTANGGPGSGCTSQLSYGSFQAVGCWRLNADPSALPKPTKALLDEMIRGALFGNGGSVPKLVQAPSRGGVAYGRLLSGDGIQGSFPFGRAHASASLVEYALAAFAATANSTYIADGAVRVNGIDVIPTKGKIAFVGGGTLKDAKAKLIGEGATMVASSPFGKLPMSQGELFERFGPSDSNSPLGDLNIAKKLPLVPGLGIQGDVSARMEKYKLLLGANASVPALLGGITSQVNLTASNEKGLEVDYFKLSAIRAPLGPVILKNMIFEWIGPEKKLTAGLEATILFQIGAGGTIVFRNGNFQSLRVHAESFPGVVLGPGVHLSALDAFYNNVGPVIEGGGTLTLGPNPGGGCPKAGVIGSARLDFNWPITLSVAGNTQLACFSVAQMGASINETGYGSFFGRINPDLSPLPISVDGAVGGQVQVPIDGKNLVFQIDAQASGCVNLGRYFGKRVRGCLPKGDLTATDRAVGFCLDFDWIEAGIRMFYPDPRYLVNPVTFAGAVIANSKILFPGCDLGSYRPFPVKFAKAPANAKASASSSFTLPAGRKAVAVAVRGEGGPPDIILHGPGGRTIDVPTGELVHNATHVAFRLQYDNSTYVIIRNPQAGDWSVELKPGSPKVTAIEAADQLPDVKLKAKLKRTGSGRELAWSINKRKGQSVRFVETAGPKAGQFLAAPSTKAKGRIRFTPADSRTSSHKIIAYVSQDGAPRKTLTIARFKAPLAKIGRAKIRAKRRGSKLAIKWSAAKNAQAYRVFVQLSDGRKLFFTPSARKRRLVVSGVSKQDKATVTVIGERKGGRLGPKARAKVRGSKRK